MCVCNLELEEMLVDPCFRLTVHTGSAFPNGARSIGFLRFEPTTAIGSSRASCPYTTCTTVLVSSILLARLLLQCKGGISGPIAST